MPLADIGARDHHLGAHGLGMQYLLARHLVGHDKERAITLASADEREAEARIAGGRLDDRAAGPEPAVGFGCLDHGARRPVLQGPGRIEAFKLEEEPSWSAVETRHFHERRLADEIEDRGHG